MKKKKVLCLIVSILLFLGMFTFQIRSVYAYDFNAAITSVDTAGTTSNLETKTKTIMGSIVNVTRIIGTGIALIMLLVIAIKYMTGAPADKADYQKKAIPFVVGAVILFSSTNILKLIYDFANTNTSTK